MDENIFINLIKLAKTMKKAIIVIDNDCIYGTDENFITLDLIYPEIEYHIDYTIQIRMNTEFNNFLKNTTSIEIKNNHLLGHTLECDIELYYNQADIYYMKELYYRCMNFKNQPVYSNDDLKADSYFGDTLLKLKTADGARFYDIKNTFRMSTFNVLHPVNKNDKLRLNLYHIDESSFLSEFIIDKKKYLIYEYIRYRYL